VEKVFEANYKIKALDGKKASIVNKERLVLKEKYY
jgi:hypothetical protein